MQTLNELLKRNIISDLVFRDISNSLSVGDYNTIDDGLKYNKIDNNILKVMRSEIFGLELYLGEIDIDFETLKIFGQEFCRENYILPLKNGVLGILDPENKKALKGVQDSALKAKLDYQLFVISKSEYDKGLELILTTDQTPDPQPKSTNNEDYREDLILSDVRKAVVGMDKKEINNITESNIDLKSYKGDIENIPIEKLVNSVLFGAIDGGASDIHIEHTGESSRVRYRVDGVLEQVMSANPKIHQSVVARIKILSDMKLDEKRKPQDGRFSVRVKNGEVSHKIDFRVSTMPAYYGEKVVMRILDSYRGIRKMENVGFSATHLDQIRRALERPYGMIIISGPTGSGKTTTLYSMLNELDRERRNVVSLEDPIEYNVPNMNQSQIFPEVGYTFATGLRSILRQDPDVIMVGEIRDKETAELAIQAALTGHLVFSTIHTNNSIGVITRLMDMGVDPYLIAPTMILSIAQRLVPMISPSCASPMEMSPALKNIITEQFKDLPDVYKTKLNLDRPFYEALPNESSITGTKGRMPVLEILEIDNDVQNAILTKKSEDEIKDLARSKGMISMREDALIKSLEGKVPFVEIAGL